MLAALPAMRGRGRRAPRSPRPLLASQRRAGLGRGTPLAGPCQDQRTYTWRPPASAGSPGCDAVWLGLEAAPETATTRKTLLCFYGQAASQSIKLLLRQQVKRKQQGAVDSHIIGGGRNVGGSRQQGDGSSLGCSAFRRPRPCQLWTCWRRHGRGCALAGRLPGLHIYTIPPGLRALIMTNIRHPAKVKLVAQSFPGAGEGKAVK
eukprot:scaffold150042_cov46-Prasinocladus_malaysianus.AAC.1